uniref:Uncharacterized protein n=1 Tax=Chromera velia CCMP2878 TaxID=1169474 RepID=A0A0G4HSB1_9ALVE|eukprot:Cvel_8235.t1-p1 / transcript=Cvel_8235.t1 / gene=Cvel_8235 / organism=Chromera_velia_CCMP2878 / gene_product=hypothetical protein / transcript_product=hypothetical protein / location=Cvel_scaffold450:26245-26847(+) / protein_length=201 / sequence_SO=supercontig / SO=protein_coding / is_pseudo=false
MAFFGLVSDTLVSSRAALAVAAVFGIFSVLVAHFALGVLSTLALLPTALFFAFVAARIDRGLPATLRGVPHSGEASEERQQRTTGVKKPRRPRFDLVAMPINHYGEKLRWCMDLIKVPYRGHTTAGLLSAYFRGRSVPWLVDRWSCSLIGNSDEAIWFLNAVHVPSLQGPEREKAAKLLQRTETTMAWEQKLNDLGHAVQG